MSKQPHKSNSVPADPKSWNHITTNVAEATLITDVIRISGDGPVQVAQQVAQGNDQASFSILKEGDSIVSTAFSGQLVPVFDHTHSINAF